MIVTSENPKKGTEQNSMISLIVLIFGLLLFMFSTAMLLGGFHLILQYFIQLRLQIAPGTETEYMWINTPMPLFMNIYMFNITNPKEFEQGEKPKLQEFGPYVYREYHVKKDIIYHKNMSVTFSQKRFWIWDEERSGSNKPTDEMYTVNVIPVTAAYAFEGDEILMMTLNSLINSMKAKLIVKATVAQILFQGYQDPLLDFVRSYTKNTRISLPLNKGIMDYDKFGWFYKSNNSVLKPINMFTGKSGLRNIGQINWFDFSNETEFFDPPCNLVLGSAGELWPPGYNEDYIQFYFPELCMSPKLYYLKAVKDMYGNPGRRYWGSERTFANASLIPEHKCYCVNRKCGPNGFLDAQTCRLGAPTYMSFPHFFNADPRLLQTVEGLRPDPEKHRFYLDINSELGLPLEVAARLQINVEVKPYPGKTFLNIGRIDIMEKVPSVIVPSLWFEVLGHMTPEMSDEAKLPIMLLSSSAHYYVFGSLLIISLILLLFVGRKMKRRINWAKDYRYETVKQ